MEAFSPEFFIQTGALGIFVWYTLQNNRDWRAYLTERNSKLEKSLDRLGSILEKHNKEII